MGSCEEIINKLRSIEYYAEKQLSALTKLTEDEGTTQSIVNGWTKVKKGKAVFYSKDVTLTGSTQTEVVFLERKPIRFNRVGLFFNSANARTFNIRAYNVATATYYNTLDTQTANTATSRILEFGAEYKYHPHKIEFNFSSYTASDIVSIEVQVDEL